MECRWFWPALRRLLYRGLRRHGYNRRRSEKFLRYQLDLSIVTPVALKELVRAHQYEPSHDECELLVTSGFLPIERFVS